MPKFAQRMYDLEGSASVIRALFGAMGDANIISFGGGAPARQSRSSALSAMGWEVAHRRREFSPAVLSPRPLPPKAQICSFKWQLSRKELYN